MFFFTSQFGRKVRNSRILNRVFNILMIILCFIACIALYFIQQQIYKIAISIILVVYSIFICFHQNLFRLTFRLNNKEDEKQNDKSSISNGKKVQNQVNSKNKKDETAIIKNSRLSSQQHEQTLNLSKSNLFKDIPKDSSFSSFRSISASYNIQRSKTNLNQSKGFSLQSLFNFSGSQSQRSILNKSLKQTDKSFTIVQRKISSRNFQQKLKNQNEHIYQYQLKTQIKKTQTDINISYKKILNEIQKILTPIINQHKNTHNKLKQLCNQYYDITIIDQKQGSINVKTLDHAYFKFKKDGQNLQVPYQTLIFKLFTIFLHNMNPQFIGISVRKNKNWNNFLLKLNQILRNRMKLSQQLGISSQNIKIRSNEPLISFIQNYNKNILMIQTFVKSDLTDKKIINNLNYDLEDQNSEHVCRSRVYALYLFVKFVNESKKSQGRVQLNTYLNLAKTVYQKVQISIKPKYVYDSIVPHFNVQKNENKKVYNCQYGQKNYLSVIYFTLWCLKQKISYSVDGNLYKLIHEII